VSDGNVDGALEIDGLQPSDSVNGWVLIATAAA
jgi:hypothetical protein